MSDEAVERKIAQLEQDKRVAEELLFLVLDHVDEPVVLNIEEAKSQMRADRIIDLDLNAEDGTMTLQVVTISGD